MPGLTAKAPLCISCGGGYGGQQGVWAYKTRLNGPLAGGISAQLPVCGQRGMSLTAVRCTSASSAEAAAAVQGAGARRRGVPATISLIISAGPPHTALLLSQTAGVPACALCRQAANIGRAGFVVVELHMPWGPVLCRAVGKFQVVEHPADGSGSLPADCCQGRKRKTSRYLRSAICQLSRCGVAQQSLCLPSLACTNETPGGAAE